MAIHTMYIFGERQIDLYMAHPPIAAHCEQIKITYYGNREKKGVTTKTT
jgi:hypothetical protein